MTDRQVKECAAIIAAEKNETRRAAMMRYFDGREHDSGAYGRIVELASHTEKSRKVRVAAQGKEDTYVKVLINGKIRYEVAEVKTNGGRIEGLYTKNAPRYVVYTMDFSNSIASRHVPAVVMPTGYFLSMLEACGAIKQTNGANNERAIQVTSKKLYCALSDYPIPYEPDTVYDADDFDGFDEYDAEG